MGFLALGLLFCVCFLLTFWGLKFLNKIWWRPKMLEKNLRKLGKFHVLPYKPPFGNFKEIMKAKSSNIFMKFSHDIASFVDPFVHQLVTAHQKPVVIWTGMRPNIIVLDRKLIKEILKRNYEIKKPEVAPTMKLFLSGLAFIEGDKWVMHRKIITPAFNIEKLKGMLPSFMECCEEMVEKWDKLIGSKDSVELDALSEFQNLSGDIISRACFGSNLEEGKAVFSLQRKQGRFLLQSVQYFLSPLSWFLVPNLKKKMMKINKEVGNILGGLIKNRENAMLSGMEYQDDLLNQLLKSNFNEIRNTRKMGMSRDDVIEECKLFYLAGHESTANLLTWTIIVLSMHQNWQDKARSEVVQLIGKNKPNFNDLNHFKIVNMILLEVLRLYPPGLLVRSIEEDTKIGEYTFLGGSTLTIPTYMVHRDPQVWGEDANEFNPNRFSNGISKASKDPSCFFAFGWGPRNCIGQNFAMLESKLALALILQKFSFRLSPSYKHSPSYFITLQPQFGAPIILASCSSLSDTNVEFIIFL